MKAPRLRVGLVLLGIAALLGGVLGPTPAVAAEEDLDAALADYAAGRYEMALEKLRAYVASEPGSDEVYAVLRDADEKVLLRVLARQGDHERLMNYLLDKARPATRDRGLDPDEIQEFVDVAVNDDSLDKRRHAGVRLAVVGPLAVPYLYPYLARSDAAVVVNTMFAIHRLGTSAVPALVEVLETDNPRVRGNVAAVLGDLRDPLAIPALLRVKEVDADESVRKKADAAVQKIGAGRATPQSAANAFWSLGERFYANDPTVVLDFGDMRNVWRWEDGDLARFTVHAYFFGYQMAEQMAVDALTLNPGLLEARSLLVRSLLAQKVEADVIAIGGGDVPEVLTGAFDLAATQGFEGATAALRDSLKNRDWDVAIQCLHLCVRTYGRESLDRHPLGAALIAPERRVRYEAAIAALRMSPKGLPNADKVAHLAARAASERAVRQVLVLDNRAPTRNRLLMDLAHAGFVAASAANGARGVAVAKNAPTLDVVIVRADLSDPTTTIPSRRHVSSLTVIDELKSDVRTRDMRILVLVEETSDAKIGAVKEFFQNKYGDKLAGFLVVPLDTASIVEVVTEAAEAGDLNPGRERANELAVRAALAFAETDFTCSTFDLKIAVEPLCTAALGGPTNEVRLAAVMALGNIREGGAEALVEIMKSDDAEDELKAAAATALGGVLSVVDGTEDQIGALIEVSNGDGPVAEAAFIALGHVKGITPEQQLKLFESHRLSVAESAGS